VWIPQGGSGGSYIPAAIKIVLDGQSVQIQKSNLTKSEVVVETDLLVPIEDLYVGLPPKIFQKKTVESAFRKLAQTAVGRWTVPLTRDSNNNKPQENAIPLQSNMITSLSEEPTFEIYADNAEDDEGPPTAVGEQEDDDFNDHELDYDQMEERKRTIKQFLCDLDSDEEEREGEKLTKIKGSTGDSDEGKPHQPTVKKIRIVKTPSGKSWALGKKDRPKISTQKESPPLMEEKRPDQKKPPRPVMSEYELIQQKNIEERQNKLKELMLSDAKKAVEIPKKKKPVAHRRGTARPLVVAYSTRTEPIQLRNRSVSSSDLLPGLGTPTKRFKEEEEVSDEYESPAKKSRRTQPTRWHKNPNTDVPTPDDITDEMMENVADAVSEKVYDQSVGTSCHQCRQKTLDTKTICRSGSCVGVRGAFCGVCLRNRYGQDAREALKDPEWSCPPCNNKCNCSICRNRAGKCATGILTPQAQERGYDNVADYLEAIKKEMKKTDKGFVAE